MELYIQLPVIIFHYYNFVDRINGIFNFRLSVG